MTIDIDPVQTHADEKREALFDNIFLGVLLVALAAIVSLMVH